MDHSQSNPVLSDPEPESDALSASSPSPKESPSSVSAQAGVVARELIAIRSLEEGEEHVMEALQKASGLDWSALYRPANDRYQLARSTHANEAKVPMSVEGPTVAALLEDIRRVGSCNDKDLSPRLRHTRLLVRLDSEFDPRPALIVLGQTEPDESRSIDLRLTEAIAEVCSAGLTKLELIERLRSEIFVDFLTECYNRRALEEHLNVELVRAKRYERPLCLLLLDLDGFKDINDVLGHQAGDYVLRRVGAVLRSSFRTTDRVCRYGGDEFAVIFPETRKDEVVRLAERLRRQLAKLFPDDVIPSGITSSIGVASYPFDAGQSDDLVRIADQAMYRAKQAGRNQVVPA